MMIGHSCCSVTTIVGCCCRVMTIGCSFCWAAMIGCCYCGEMLIGCSCCWVTMIGCCCCIVVATADCWVAAGCFCCWATSGWSYRGVRTSSCLIMEWEDEIFLFLLFFLLLLQGFFMVEEELKRFEDGVMGVFRSFSCQLFLGWCSRAKKKSHYNISLSDEEICLCDTLILVKTQNIYVLQYCLVPVWYANIRNYTYISWYRNITL